MNNKYTEIGKVVNTFGIKGELKIQSESDFVDYRFAVGKTIYFKMGRIIKDFKVTSYRILKGNVVITVNDLKDINLVEQYIGSTVLADANDVPPLDDDEFLIDDLVGLKAYDEQGQYYGEVVDVIMIPNQEILEIKDENAKPTLIPFVDEYIISIDEEKIIIKPLEVDHD